MTFTEALSDKSISALIEATEIGKEKLGDNFYSATIKKSLKHGFVATISEKNGRNHILTVKYDGSLKLIRFE